MDETSTPSEHFTELTSDIVSAYVSKNNVPTGDLPALIASVHAALAQLSQPQQGASPKHEPPMPWKKAIKPDHIISFEDGRGYKSLKRHLSSRGLTPEQYREKWGLPPSFPMVAPTTQLPVPSWQRNWVSVRPAKVRRRAPTNVVRRRGGKLRARSSLFVLVAMPRAA